MKKNYSFNKQKIWKVLSVTFVILLTTFNINAQYCTPSYVNSCTSNDVITNFAIGTLNNPSSCSSGNYGDFTTLPAPSLYLGTSYQAAVSTIFGSAGACIWIDFNDDFTFDPSERVGATTSYIGANSTGSVTVSLPIAANTGTHRLRVRLIYNDLATNADPCIGYNYGEAEDYLVSLIPLPPCTGSPIAGDAVSSLTLACANTAFDLNLMNNGTNSGLTYQWQSSPNGSTWTNLGSLSIDPSYSISSISSTTYYQCVVTCTNSTQSSTATSVVVNLNPLMNCYCIPGSITCGQDKIVDFSIANVIGQTTNCDAFGFSDSTSSGYTFVNLNGGITYTLTVNTALSGFNDKGAVGAWIDYNQNSVFEPIEFIYVGLGYSGTYSTNFTVPATALGGAMRIRLKFDAYYPSAATVFDPCASGAYGQIIDYKVNMTPAPACSGTPNSANSISTSTAVCPNQPFTIDLTNYSIASSIIYQWQSSLNGTTWSNLGASQNTIPYSVATQSITTYYRCISTCTLSTSSNTSTPIMVSQNLPTACYCYPEQLYCSSVSIYSVSFSNLNYSPQCNFIDGYTNYRDSVAAVNLNAGQAYTLLTAVTTFSSSASGHVSLWIDYDQNGVFDTNEFTAIGSYTTGNLSQLVNIPFTAIGGNTGMRLKIEDANSNYSGADPCIANGSSGQILDYLVNITPVTPCTGAPNAGDATAPVSAICENRAFTLDLVNNDIVSNISYQWQSSTDHIVWTNLGTPQTTVPYTVYTQSTTSFYRCLTTCTTSANTSTSTVWSVAQNAATACYCIPELTNCSGNEVINYVALAAMTNTSSCDGIDGYSDYTATVASATVASGQSYTLTTVSGYMYGQHIYAWVDYNQDGQFQSSEYYDFGLNSGNDTIKGTINIPLTATPGNTRMRVRNFSGFSLYSNDACNSPTGAPKSTLPISVNGSGPYGETEDYLITILPPDCGSVNFPPTIPITGATNICLGQISTIDVGASLPVASGITYQWHEDTGSGFGGPIPNAATISAQPSVNTSFYCEILCNGSIIRISDTILVNVNMVTMTPTSTSVICNAQCNGGITFNASSTGLSGFTYSMTPAVGSFTNGIASNLCANTYTIDVTNSIGCTSTQTIAITEPAALTTTPSQTNISCFGLTDGIASVNTTGGVGPYNYSWSPFVGTNSTVTNLAANNYTVIVLDANGCAKNQTFTITEPLPFTVSITGSGSSICEQLEDTVKSTIIGGISPYSYNWMQLPSTSVSSNSDYTYTTSIGTFSYALTVTDLNNCIANSNTVSITVNPSSNFSGTVTTGVALPVAGRVVLYKYLPFYTRFDSVAGQNISAASDFLFNSFTAGTYIIKAIPTATNIQVAYGDSAVNWKTAKQIIHGCAVNDIQNIYVRALQTFTPGPGTLTGIITQTVGYQEHQKTFGSANNNNNIFKPTAPGGPIGGIVVKGGRNPGGQMFVQTTTSSDSLTPGSLGTYTLSGLPYGDYFVLVDIPGLDTNSTYHVHISATDTVFHNLDFTVDSIQINPIFSTNVGVHEINSIESKIKIYPNPASNYVTIQYDLKTNSTVKIELFDILGKSIKTLQPQIQQPKDIYKTSWQLEDIKSGLYFIKININGVESTTKLSITN